MIVTVEVADAEVFLIDLRNRALPSSIRLPTRIGDSAGS